MSKELKAWFTVDELNAWADKKLKENPQWAEQQAQQEPVWDASAPLVMTPHPAFQQPAQKRPQNCGTSYCSCIECVMEPAQGEKK